MKYLRKEVEKNTFCDILVAIDFERDGKNKMNYQKTLDYITSLNQYGSVLGLDNMHRLCDRLGHPEDKCKVIHIAGTNGKGSTSAYIAHMLMAAGYRVGRYISPVISDYRERFQIGRRMITQKDLCVYVERVKEVCDGLTKEGFPHPTPFEVETALGFLYFADKQCDFVVLETGMGGETDATNVVKHPAACVWTSISMDHMHFLGKTLSDIARVKAGIAKSGAVLVSCLQQPQAMEQLLKAAKQAGGSLQVADVNKAGSVKYGLTTQQFSYKEFTKLKLHLAGTFQIENAVLAVETILQLRSVGVEIPDKAVYAGLEDTVWQGRLEVLQKKPLFLIDGAHNEDAAKKLASSIETYLQGKRLIYIMGVLKDKEYEKILALTAGYASHILTITPPDNPRALSALALAMAAREYHPQVTNLDSLEEAVEVAHLLAGREDVILCFGSLSFLGAVKEIMQRSRHGR